MNLVSDDILERSAVVANCRMNRERNLIGSNGYDKELGLNPLDFLRGRVASSHRPAWLDLCCGTGKALIEAARIVHAEGLGSQFEIVGVDLAGMFLMPEPGLDSLRLVETSLRTWRPVRQFDLITCVHGLHYIGDKLALISRAASWLVEHGQFVANLDLDNLRIADNSDARRKLVSELRRAGLEFDRKRRLISCWGWKDLDLPFRYLGADDTAGPNYTGQPSVNSHYKIA
jgi:SAM-dependent methyltransferase